MSTFPPPKSPLVVHHKHAPFDVYVGRPSPWGNPFSWCGKLKAIRLYREWVLKDPDMVARIKRELRGKVLGCWCRPEMCHGDVLAEIANEPDPV